MSIKHFSSPHPDVSKSILQCTPVLVSHPRAFRGFSREQWCCFNPPVQFCFTQPPKSSRCQITRPTLIIKFASSSRTCCCMGSDGEPGWCNAVCTAGLSAAPFSPAAGTRSSHRREGGREGGRTLRALCGNVLCSGSCFRSAMAWALEQNKQ